MFLRRIVLPGVLPKLWDSWDDAAPLGDKAAGRWGDDDKLYPPEHVGRYFRVAGPLNVPRSPQGYPLLVQAGSSEDGKELAARYAEAVFTAQQTLAEAQAFYRDLKQRAAQLGRYPESIKILPGIVPAIGATLRVAPEDLDLDRELPADLPSEDEIEGAKSRYTLIVTLARRERLTVRQLIGRLGGGRGHRTFAGTPQQVADAIEEWYRADLAEVRAYGALDSTVRTAQQTDTATFWLGSSLTLYTGILRAALAQSDEPLAGRAGLVASSTSRSSTPRSRPPTPSTLARPRRWPGGTCR
ncbi:LLM class flavin-dependent oxidoreductase [Micromonospora endophytica]|uniref:LLM class flavin-dependent oxidoreductase n=1 Tax=Micromonospora endophytica TaxID=515350 RepID=UPI001C332E02|nr:LLM class flavin-dependent oxidoreductase [Micromonospora endophytica]BCJ62002.1 hypothetical protein Jiend_54240 [Micromonospora endophytica]